MHGAVHYIDKGARSLNGANNFAVISRKGLIHDTPGGLSMLLLTWKF